MTVFVRVDDIEEAPRNAERLRGRTMADPVEFPDKRPSAHGKGPVKFAYFADPKGHVIGLRLGIVRQRGDPTDAKREVFGDHAGLNLLSHIAAAILLEMNTNSVSVLC